MLTSANTAKINLSRKVRLDSYLAADGIELPASVLDRIDEIVPPAVTINVADNMWNVGTTALGCPEPAGPSFALRSSPAMTARSSS